MKKKGKREESDFQMTIKQSVDNFNRLNPMFNEVGYRKFSDGKKIDQKTGRTYYSSMGYDCEFLFFPKNLICLELKMNKDTVSTMNMKSLFSDREHEMHKLIERKSQGFQSLVLVNHYILKSNIDDVYIFTPELCLEVFHGKGSLKIKDLQDIPMLERIYDPLYKRYVYDIEPLLFFKQ